jgi:DNA-binding NarL/FixJ family response regulator
MEIIPSLTVQPLQLDHDFLSGSVHPISVTIQPDTAFNRNPEDDAETMKSDTDRRRKRVVIVDDHPLVRKWLAALINQQPDLKVCGQAANKSAALELIATSKPDVAIVDIPMEGRSRMEAIKTIKAMCPEVLVIVLSMHDELVYGERALRAGAKGYVMKRKAARKVLQAIRCVLDGKLFLINEITRLSAANLIKHEPLAPGFPLDLISDREFEIFKLLGRGYDTKKIAEELNITVSTVRTFCARIRDKLKLPSSAQLLDEAVVWTQNHKMN